MRLLFISNLFPDTREPYRGLDNATVLHHLAAQWEIRALALVGSAEQRGMLLRRRGVRYSHASELRNVQTGCAAPRDGARCPCAQPFT